MKKFIKHCNKNQGFYSFILSGIVAIVALLSLLFTLYPQKSPDIQLFTDAPDDLVYVDTILTPSFDLIIYNKGEVPCFDVELTTDAFIQTGKFREPENRLVVPLVDTTKQETYFYLGTILPEEVLRVDLTFIDLENYYSKDNLDLFIRQHSPSTLHVKCIGDSVSKDIRFGLKYK